MSKKPGFPIADRDHARNALARGSEPHHIVRIMDLIGELLRFWRDFGNLEVRVRDEYDADAAEPHVRLRFEELPAIGACEQQILIEPRQAT